LKPTTCGISIETGWPSNGLGLNAADAPTEDAEAVDHRGVRISADERVRVGERVAGVRILAGRRAFDVAADEDDTGEVFEVDLVDDPRLRRHDAEILERRLAPPQECVPFFVAFVLEPRIVEEGETRSEIVHLHRVVDHEFDGL
jgi:hypothetical protein